MLENKLTRPARKITTATARRERVRFMSERGLNERRSLFVVAIDARVFRYQPAANQHECLHAKLLRLA